MSRTDVLQILASLAKRGYVELVGTLPDGDPKYEVTERGHAALRDSFTRELRALQ